MNSRATVALMVAAVGFVIGFLRSEDKKLSERIFFGGGLGALIAVLFMGAFLIVFGDDSGGLDPGAHRIGTGR